MKKLLLLLPFILLSCSKGDENEPEENLTKADLVGMWDIQTFSLGGDEHPLSDCMKQSTLNFVSDDLIYTSAFIDNNEECIIQDIDFEYSLRDNSIFIDNTGLGGFRFYGKILEKNTIQFQRTYNGSDLTKIVNTYKRR